MDLFDLIDGKYPCVYPGCEARAVNSFAGETYCLSHFVLRLHRQEAIQKLEELLRDSGLAEWLGEVSEYGYELFGQMVDRLRDEA